MLQQLTDVEISDDRIRIIHLGIDAPHWNYQPWPAPAQPRFVFIGCLKAKQGSEDVIGALACLRDRYDMTAQIDVIAAGLLESSLRQAVNRIGLDGQVQFIGPLPRNAVAAYLSDATALVLPHSMMTSDGDSEGTPVVLMEAQPLGLPSMTTRHAANPEVLPPRALRFIVAAHDVNSLAAAMARIVRFYDVKRRTLQDGGRA